MSTYLWAKLIWAIALVVGIGLASFFYRLFTGRPLRDLFRRNRNGE